MVDYKDSEIRNFHLKEQPKCPHKRLLPCIINGYTLKVFVCSRTDKNCSIKNCPNHEK